MTDQRIERFAGWAAAALVAAAAQFVVLTVIAMFVYAGGSKSDPAAAGYAFFHNFFSDLGMTETFAGEGNTAASALFTYALICVGVALVAYGVAVRRLRGTDRGTRLAATVATAAALVSGIGYVGIACTPHNLAGGAHSQFVDTAFGFLLIFVGALTYLEVRAAWPRRWIVANAVYLVLLAIYVYLLFWGPSTETERGLVIQVIAQKIIVYSSVMNLGWQALGLRWSLRAGCEPGETAEAGDESEPRKTAEPAGVARVSERPQARETA